MLEIFSDNILKLINNSVFYNHTPNLTTAFLTLPDVIVHGDLIDVTDYTNLCYCFNSSFLLFFLVLLL